MVQGQYMKKSFNAVFFALLMATMSLAGCFGGNDNEQIDGNETPVETLDEWQVHFANAASDLPECNENRIGWLYYMSEDQNFRGCTSFGWELIDVTGPIGTDGGDGADGQNGADGSDGVSTLINAVNSTSCLNGGTTFEIGSDDNADGVLTKPKSPSTSATVYKDQKVLKCRCRWNQRNEWSRWCRWCTGSSRSTRASRCRWNQRNEWSGWRRWG